MLHCIAIDDEPAALEIIAHHCTSIPFVKLEACFTNPVEAFDLLEKQPIDLIFLDISMPGLSGFQFWNMLPKKPKVVFTTAFSEYATKAFEVEAIDYLMKPIVYERFLSACVKASQQLKQSVPVPISNEHSNNRNHFFVRQNAAWHRINFEELTYAMSDGNYVRFFLKDKELMGRHTLQEIMELLPADQFAQIHRRYLVNLNAVQKFTSETVSLGEIELPLGNHYRENFTLLLTGK